ncbi:MAG: UvrB/UvrC motif-containing protein [Chitinispirillales bacterium]|jgi:protein arginine kinase activator|nr:UvrB/UvrC motif-containing protein [Chitinispirillales bacterium]
MKQCDDCGINQATVHLTHIIQNETQVFHLCEECATKRGIVLGDGTDTEADITAVVNEMLEEEIICPKCGLKLSEFRSGGWLGCMRCYSAFEEHINKILFQVHGCNQHKGKRYGIAKGLEDVSCPHSIERLRSDLDEAIKNEQFEQAAILRDAIYLLRQDAN